MQISPGTHTFLLSIHLPHLPYMVPCSYWASTCVAALPSCIAWCDFCTSDQRFAIRLPSDSQSPTTPLPLAISFPLPGGFGTCTRWNVRPPGAQQQNEHCSYEQCSFYFILKSVSRLLWDYYVPNEDLYINCAYVNATGFQYGGTYKFISSEIMNHSMDFHPRVLFFLHLPWYDVCCIFRNIDSCIVHLFKLSDQSLLQSCLMKMA